MRTSLSGAFTLTAFAATMVVASTIPATSQVARPLSGLAASDSGDGLVIEVRRGGGGRGGGGGFRGGGGGFRGGGGFHGGGARFAGAGHRGGAMHVARHGGRHVNVTRHVNVNRNWNGNGWGWGAAGVAVGAAAYGYGAYGYPYGYAYGYDYDCVRYGGCTRD